MMLSRRKPSAAGPKIKLPSSSGPRWRIALDIAFRCCSGIERPFRSRIPQIPHILSNRPIRRSKFARLIYGVTTGLSWRNQAIRVDRMSFAHRKAWIRSGRLVPRLRRNNCRRKSRFRARFLWNCLRNMQSEHHCSTFRAANCDSRPRRTYDDLDHQSNIDTRSPGRLRLLTSLL